MGEFVRIVKPTHYVPMAVFRLWVIRLMNSQLLKNLFCKMRANLSYPLTGQQLRAIYRLYVEDSMAPRVFTRGSESSERVGRGQWSCTECNNIFPTKREAEEHYRVEHPEARETITPQYRVVVAITQPEA